MYGLKFTPQAKIQRVIQMVSFLINGRWTIEQFALKFDITTRTAYRYLTLIESLDFAIDKDWEDRFFIVEGTCPICGEKHKSRENKRQDVHQSSFTNPAFFN